MTGRSWQTAARRWLLRDGLAQSAEASRLPIRVVLPARTLERAAAAGLVRRVMGEAEAFELTPAGCVLCGPSDATAGVLASIAARAPEGSPMADYVAREEHAARVRANHRGAS